MEKLKEVKGTLMYGDAGIKHQQLKQTNPEYFEIKGSDYGVKEAEIVRIVEMDNMIDLLSDSYANKFTELKDAFEKGHLSKNVLTYFIASGRIVDIKVVYSYYIFVPSLEVFLSDVATANALLYHEFGHLKDFFKRHAVDDEVYADDYAIKHGYAKELLDMSENVRILYSHKENNEEDMKSLEERIQNIKSKM